MSFLNKSRIILQQNNRNPFSKAVDLFMEYRWEILLFLLLIIVLMFITPANYQLLAGLILTAGIIFWLNLKPSWGLWLIGLTFPFINWQIYLSQNLNAPPVDWIGLILLFATLVLTLRTNSYRQFKLPLLLYFLIFFMVALISVGQSYFWEIGLKYILRPYLFCYLVYLVLPANLIKSEQRLWQMIKLIYLVSLLVALLSLLYSIFFAPEQNEIFRMVPFSLGNFQPLGSNQNLLAELMVLAVPLAACLGFITYQRHKLFGRLIMVSIFFLVAVLLLTLSRAGWLVLGLQIIFFWLWIWPNLPNRDLWRKKFKQFFQNYLALFLLFTLMAGFLMLQLFSSPVVSSSDSNRILQWKIGLEMLRSNYLFGTGPGSFMEVLNRDPYFQYEFGSNLDAHGLALKLLSEVGILGTLFFILFLFILLRRGVKILLKLKDRQNEYLILSCLLLTCVSALVFQLFNTSYLTAKMWLPLGIFTAAAYLYERKIYEKKSSG